MHAATINCQRLIKLLRGPWLPPKKPLNTMFMLPHVAITISNLSLCVLFVIDTYTNNNA